MTRATPEKLTRGRDTIGLEPLRAVARDAEVEHISSLVQDADADAVDGARASIDDHTPVGHSFLHVARHAVAAVGASMNV
jgi:hypothetical protein